MADEQLHIKEGTTSAISLQLLADGEPIDLTTATIVRVTMMDKLRKAYRYNHTDSPSYVTIDVASDGQISFTPPDQTIFRYNKSPYQLVVWVYDSTGKRYACPEEGANIIEVEPEF